MSAKRATLKKENLETYIFSNKRPQPKKICGQIAFTTQKKPSAMRGPTCMLSQLKLQRALWPLRLQISYWATRVKYFVNLNNLKEKLIDQYV